MDYHEEIVLGRGMQTRCSQRRTLCKNSENDTSRLAKHVHDLFVVAAIGGDEVEVRGKGALALPS
eukprot:3624565-Prorocentrum_lima.AAC.1